MNIDKRFLIILLTMVLFFNFSYADTIIDGIVETSVWTPEGNPYYIISESEVPADNILVIKPGVIVYTYPNHSFIIYGELYCEGTEYDSIIFTGYDQQNRWDGLRILDGGYASLQYTTIEYAGTVRPEEMHGGGISVAFSTIVMTHCTVRYNHANYDGGGMYYRYADFNITQCEFYENTCGRCGSAVSNAEGGGGVFSYNLVYNNYAAAGAAYYIYRDTRTIDHCTFYNNTSSELTGDIRIYIGGHGIFTNTIFWRDSAHFDESIELAGGTMEAYYCCNHDVNMLGVNIIHSDPLFIDPDNYDLHLSGDSPCIDTGDPNYPYDEDGTITDMGALPSTSNNPPPPPPEEENTVSIPEIAVLPGETYTIPVVCGPLTEDNIISFEGKIVFPGEILESINNAYFIEGGFFENNWLFEYSLIQDTLLFSMAGSEAFNGSEPLFQMEFTVDDDILPGTYNIVFLELLTNEDIVLDLESGGIIVTDYELGDVSLNGEVQAYDAGLLLTHLDNSNPLEQIQLQLGEVSGDGTLSGYDASLILQKVAGVIDHFPVESYIFINENGNILVPSEVTNSNSTFTIPFGVDFLDNVSSIVVDLTYDRNINSLPTLSNASEELYSAIEPAEDGAKIHIVFNEPLTCTDQQLFELTFESESDYDQVIHVNYIKFNDFTYDDSIDDITIHWSSSTEENDLPAMFGILETYPNPFNSSTSIRFNVQSSVFISIAVVNILGQLVDQLVDDKQYEKGIHSISWNAYKVPAGNYFIVYSVGGRTQISKITLLK